MTVAWPWSARAGREVLIAKLILVNGPPGVGKSSLARRYAEAHPLSLHLEIDAIRMSIGGWEEHDESKLLARSIAVAMAQEHLRGGHDVLVAQYLGRTDFIETLDQLARDLGVEFVEILLLATETAVVDRFRARRVELAASDRPHPERDVDDAALPEVVARSLELLADVRAARPRTRVIAAGDEIDITYGLLGHAIDS